MKKGLEPKEFSFLLKSKMEKLLVDTAHLVQNSMITKSIDDVKKRCCIRENITGSGQLDGRRSPANAGMHNEGLIPTDQLSSPSSIQRQPRGQGAQNPSTAVRSGYHVDQCSLFLELQRQNKLDSNFDPSGYLSEANGQHCTTEGMCNILDGITRTYIEEFKDLPNSAASGYSQTSIQRDRESIRNIFDFCISVVRGRIYQDWAVENDIMSEDGYKQWREHVWVLMSFAALLVMIDVLSKKPKYGLNSLLDAS